MERVMRLMNVAKALEDEGGTVELAAPAKSDFFVDERSGVEKADAPFYHTTLEGDFVLRVKVRPEFRSRYDAGGLFVMAGTRKWIKLEFELTDLGYPSVVSVVTDGSSDDANGEALPDRAEVHLQIVREGSHWALHYSLDGKKWKMVRYLKLAMRDRVRVGLEAQSPVGRGCRVLFSGFQVRGPVKNMRKGV